MNTIIAYERVYEGVRPRIYFQQVPEPKVVKNRVHLDVNVGGGAATPMDERRTLVDAAVERLCGLDATKLRPYEEYGEYWVVMRMASLKMSL